MDGTMTIGMGLGIGDWGLGRWGSGIREAGSGKTMMRPTVTGSRFCWERRAQSSSPTSRATARRPADASASSARSRIVGVSKNRRKLPSACWAAVGLNSSMSASTSSDASSSPTPATSTAGQRRIVLAEHVFDAIEQIPLVAFVSMFARPWLGLFLRQDAGQLLEHAPLLFGQLLRRLNLHGRKEITAAATVHIRHPLAA